jgi:copper chaperone CopZ
MKTIKLILMVFIYSTVSFSAISQEAEVKNTKKIEKIEIQTSAQCTICKDRIEKDMAFEKGVKSVDLDLETKFLTVEYRTDKTDPDKLREAVSKIGYDADDVAADLKAYEKLPECCKKGGHDHEH